LGLETEVAMEKTAESMVGSWQREVLTLALRFNERTNQIVTYSRHGSQVLDAAKEQEVKVEQEAKVGTLKDERNLTLYIEFGPR
jgi:hypothetical protein